MTDATIDRLETETCTRCGGTGQHSYCQMWGSTCFKCGGRGRTYTKRGAAAVAFLRSLREVPAADIVVGDLVWFDGSPLGGRKGGFQVITEAYPQQSQPGNVVISANGVSLGCAGSYMVLKGWDKDTKRQQFAAALAYQATLTKAGKPRKSGRTQVPA